MGVVVKGIKVYTFKQIFKKRGEIFIINSSELASLAFLLNQFESWPV